MPSKRHARVWTVAAILLALLSTLLSHPAATESIKCPMPLAPQVYPPTADTFVVTRPGTQNVDLRYRDLEFMVDLPYGTSETTNLKTTMDRFSRSLVDSVGSNPFGINASHFRLIYDYFRLQGSFYNPSNPRDSTSVKLADPSIEGASGYNNADRSHADVYFYPRSRSDFGGAYPSFWYDNNEDRSTGNDLAPKTANSIMVQGPDSAQFLDTQGTGWTRPRSVFATRFNHELQHSFPGQDINNAAKLVVTEMFSAGAEAIGGARDSTPEPYDVPYTWALTAEWDTLIRDLTHPLRRSSTNYQGRTQFMAYLAYNFRGRDTTTVLSSIYDDLMKQWARGSGRQLSALQSLLGDDSCKTCSTKTYFRPGGVALANKDRLPLLLHNWRVANYVNNSLLEEGQYGYPPGFGFSPAKQTGAWVNNDGTSSDDAVAIPPVVTLTSRFTTRDTVIDGWRSLDTGAYPLVVQPLGAEYWVVTSDASLWQTGQQLRVRVSTPTFNFQPSDGGFCNSPGTNLFARLTVSVVTYREPWNASDPLWKHPEWVLRVQPAKAAFTDSVRGALEFTVPAFGDSAKAVLIVLTAADGAATPKWASRSFMPYEELFRYQVQLGVIRGTSPLSGPTAFLTGSGTTDDDPAWSPRGDSLVFAQNDSSDPRQVVLVRALTGGQAAAVSTSSLSQRHPEWSPRGDWIAFSQTRPAPYGICEDLYLKHRGTGELRNVSSPSGVFGRDIRSTFSPNGQRVAYVIHELPDFGGTDRWMLRHRDLTGQTDTLLLSRAGSGALLGTLRWTPDGRWIYFAANDTLYAVGAIGPDLGKVVLRNDLIKTLKTFDLAPNSERILAEETGGFPWSRFCFDGGFIYQHFFIPFHRTALYDTLNRDTVITHYRSGAEYYNPRFSPEGTRIAYSTNQDAANDRDLWIEPIRWNHAPAFSPAPRDTVVEAGPIGFSQDFNASDADGETPTFAGLYLPSGASLNAASGAFSWPSVTGGQSHYVVLRALDPSAGVDQRVVKYTTQSAAPPAVASDFMAEFVTTNAIWFTWTSPGDDDGVGTPTQYDIRFSSSNITEGNWNSANQVGGPSTPLVAGQYESFEVSGLPACTWRYWAMKTRDEAGNWSALSPVEHIKTLCGGGGGMVAGRTGGRGEATGGSLASGTALPPQPDRVMALELSQSQALPSWSIRYLNEAQGTARLAQDTSGVIVEHRAGDGSWSRAGRITRLPAGGVGLRAAPGAGRRYLLLDNYNLTSAAGAIAAGSNAEPLVLALASAQHSRLGNMAPISSEEQASLSLAPGDTVGLGYQVETDTSRVGESWALMLTRATTSSNANESRTESQPLPVAFALHQSEPNPFAHSTTIRFDLPRGERVKLRVLDLQGRQVAVLADADFAAGRHALAWTGRSREGATLPAGIYFYRIQAGSFNAQRRMTLLP